MICFLAQFSSKPCEGRLIKAHLLPRQLLKREGFRAWTHDPRGYVYACGGALGNSGHHGMLDVARTLRVPREALPAAVEEMAEELGLLWYLDREFGLQDEQEAALMSERRRSITVDDVDMLTVETQFAASLMSPLEDLTEEDFMRLGLHLYRRALKARAAGEKKKDLSRNRAQSGAP